MKLINQVLSIFLVLLMLVGPAASVFATEDLGIVMGNAQYDSASDTFSYSQAVVTGTGLTSVMISFSDTITAGDEIILPPSPAGFSVSSTSSTNNYTKRITLSGVTASQLQDYLRQIKFKVGGDEQTIQIVISTENVEYDTFYNIDTEHYYQFIPSLTMTWIEAYNAAKNMTYMGRTGYLATIMDEAEDIFVNTLSGGKTGWLGGSLLEPTGDPVDANGGNSGPLLYYPGFNADKARDGWYWVCGPEIGMKFYDTVSYSSSPNSDTQTDQNWGSYYNWAKSSSTGVREEPNIQVTPNSTINYSNPALNNESCLTTLNIKSQGYIGKHNTDFSWNDLKYDNAGSNTWSAKGYFVEYGNELKGDSGENVSHSFVEATVRLSKTDEVLEIANLSYDKNNKQMSGDLNVDIPLAKSDVVVLINGVPVSDYTVLVEGGILYVTLGSGVAVGRGDTITVEINKKGYTQASAEFTIPLLPAISIDSPEVDDKGNNTFEGTINYTDGGVALNITAEANASWAVYADENFTQPISLPLQLQVGNNTFYIKVQREGEDDFNSYTLNLYMKNFVADLEELSVSAGELSPEFDKDTLHYTLWLKGNDDKVAFLPKVLDASGATVTVNGVAVAYGSWSSELPMEIGENAPVLIKVTAEDSSYTKTYTITPIRLSGNSNLAGISLSAGNLSPAFNENTTSYTVDVESDVSSIALSVLVSDIGNATLYINGKSVSNAHMSLPIELVPGVNVIEITVVAQDGTSKTYTVTVNKEPGKNEKSANNKLSNVEVDAGVLVPPFKADVQNYTIVVGSDVSSVKFTTFAQDEKSVVKVNGVEVASGSVSDAIAAADGGEIVITVQAEDGTTRTYVFAVIKADEGASSNAELDSLTIRAGSSTQVLSGGQSIYTIEMDENTDVISIGALAQDENAIVIINGVRVESGSLADVDLKSGANAISVAVVAEDGTYKEYTIVVIKHSGRLMNLTSDSGELLPEFDRNEQYYYMELENAVSSIRLTPYLERPSSSVTINGSLAYHGQPSGAIDLGEGINIIPIVVTAENASERTYTVIAYRKAAQEQGWEAIVALIQTLTDLFDENTDGDELVKAKSLIESAVIGYSSLSGEHKALVPDAQKDELIKLYQKLLEALGYTAKSGNVEALEGLVTNIEGTLSADDGETYVLELKVREIAPPALTVLGKKVRQALNIYVSEYVMRNSDGSILARNDNAKIKDNGYITLKIKISNTVANLDELDVAYIDAGGRAETQNASLVSEDNDLYLVFKAVKLGVFAIIYKQADKEDTGGSLPRGRSSIPVVGNVNSHNAYISGYPDVTFRPENAITRAETAVIIARLSAQYNENYFYLAAFNDLQENSWYLNQVGYGSSAGLLSGYEDGSFRPHGNITRAEFAAIVMRYLNLKPSVTSGAFSDVSGHWAQGYIDALYRMGIVSGYEDGTFRPNASITRAEAVKILNRAIGRAPKKERIDSTIGEYDKPFTDLDKSHWGYYDIIEASVTHNAQDFD